MSVHKLFVPSPGTGDTDPWLTRKQMATHLGVSLATLDRMVALGMPSRQFGRARRFKAQRAEKWLEMVGPTVKSWRDAA